MLEVETATVAPLHTKTPNSLVPTARTPAREARLVFAAVARLASASAAMRVDLPFRLQSAHSRFRAGGRRACRPEAACGANAALESLRLWPSRRDNGGYRA